MFRLIPSDDAGNGMPHPIHMHGHHFHVLKTGYPTYDPKTGRVDQQNTDIHCDTPSCNKPRWKEETWKNGNVPGLNFDHPPIKDTIIVPRGGYIVGRIRTDNPGKNICFLNLLHFINTYEIRYAYAFHAILAT